eukprot:CAMPEP_0206144896 /NCGR_PEP_ID=MMETSP1473-20131121/25800_1 /ASSEMBLY_ACC=CAM_ASM_001109 /TAXON_ID=1461547 /ORGANISM="Stichococcus sp, Strain RCC1054" /LENGTH=67 /DNA_ID=CAMNT_0053540905 /DNA_START=129 /DNA_END=329 /DNA_ORIENTATION=+
MRVPAAAGGRLAAATVPSALSSGPTSQQQPLGVLLPHLSHGRAAIGGLQRPHMQRGFLGAARGASCA